MKNWTIGKRITFGFVAVLIIILAQGIFVRTRLNVVQTGMSNVSAVSMPSVLLLADAKERLNDVSALIYKDIYSPSSSDMDQLEAKINADSQQVLKDYDDFGKIASPQTKALLEQTEAQREGYKTMRAQILALSRSATNAEASAQLCEKARAELDPLTLAYSEALTKCQEEAQKESNESTESVLSAVHSTNLGGIICLVTALLLSFTLAYVIIRSTTRVLQNISKSLNDGANQVSSAAGQVSATSQSLAEGSSEQAASIEETSASLEEMSSMTRRNAENAQKANDLAKQARQAADRGVADMQSMSGAMQEIKVSSDDIAKIIKTIDEIAFQTNILALNAAVEAARAGEAGMGFAVVADEVRNLAQRSAQAAKETAAKIEGAISKTAQGVQISSKVAEALNDIVTKARQVDELVAEVSSASREQNQGISQVNTAVGQMDKVTQSNAANAEESAAAAEELNAQAYAMKNSVTELLSLVDGNGASKGAAIATNTTAPVARSKGIRPTASPVKRTTTIQGNGHRTDTPVLSTTATARRNQIPMEGDFKDF